VYGSSAGAINATYFLSGQRDGVSIYTNEIANERFIDLRRLFRRGPGAGRLQHPLPAQLSPCN
jgi:predicted patatin/cPLA2 family phospholipase